MSPLSEQFPCFGLSILGMCSYNPAQPSSIYFSIGNAIAALGLTVAIQQFLKPIYLFRLEVYRLKITYLVSLVFLGFACAVVAMVLPSLPIPHRTFVEYPVVWELAGGLLIGIAYAATAFVSLVPARIYSFNLVPFVRAAANLLSGADDADRTSFAGDLLRHPHNFARLIRYASAWQRAESHAIAVEFDRLRQLGAPLQISGRPPISAFYEFALRRELEAANYAGSLLRIISDPHFCSALVCRCPWLTASILSEISQRRLHVDQADSFIQQIARQALINDESMVAKEVGYEGFGTAPLLSRTLFGDWFILRHYNPLTLFHGPEEPSSGYVSRLRGASKMMLKTATKSGDYWDAHYMYGAEGAYESLFVKLSDRRYRGRSNDFLLALHFGVRDLCKITEEALEALRPERRTSLFIKDMKEHRHDLIHVIASIVYKSLESIANRFLGFDDESWINAIDVFMHLYPSFRSVPAEMNPLQQQLAVQLIQKLRQNMEGFYPAISRVLLSVIGPYREQPEITTRTAFVILKDAVYKELQRLPDLQSRSPDKIADYLPPNVTYDPSSNSLTHTYRGGSVQVTRLSELNIPEIDLSDESNWSDAIFDRRAAT